jgi:ABC-type sugar transport system ATPase subunit
MNFIPTKVESSTEQELKLVSEDGSVFTLPAVKQDLSAGDSVTFGIRPEHLELEPTGDVHLNFQSEVVERLGNSTYMFGQSCGVDGFKVHLPGDQEVTKFQKMELSCKASDCHLFDTNGLRIE